MTLAKRRGGMTVVAILPMVAFSCAPADSDARDGSRDAAAGDVSADVGDVDGSAVDAGGQGDVDVGAPYAGPATLVLSGAALILDRLCDLDGDGTMDNAIADQGSPAADLLVSGVNSAIFSEDERIRRAVIHIPWVADLSRPNDPAIVAIGFEGLDDDLPRDPTDDLTGEEPFQVTARDLDPCGEPRHVLLPASIHDGSITAGPGSIPVLYRREARFAVTALTVWGELAAGGLSLDAQACGLVTILELGHAMPTSEASGARNMLEVFLQGGTGLGIPVPGISPDVDVDGDGLERLDLDEAGQLATCVDGDATVIDGADCWLDPRMADAFSVNMEVEAVSALFAGREPGWEALVDGTCDGPPPEPSLWDAI